MGFADLHRHSEASTFDGFGKAAELAELAKKLGHTSLSLTDHGTTTGLVKHYYACKEVGINCILGVEAYFQPVLNKEQPRFHLCLYAKNLKGYQNMNRLMYIGEKQKYYKPIITFKDLQEYSEGLICSTACVQGYVPKAVMSNLDLAKKATQKFVDIFGDDFYFEIQPYTISDEGVQEEVNNRMMNLANSMDVKCILTSDSHRGAKEDMDTYLKMHEIKSNTDEGYDIEATYSERYMPKKSEIANRFMKMHATHDFKSTDKAKAWAMQALKNIEEIESKCEQGILDKLEERLPMVTKSREESYKLLLSKVQDGLRRVGKNKNKEYVERCKTELAIIKMHGFEDYFLIVADYVNWAKDNGIGVGYGRGSVCNSLVAYALNITETDSLRWKLDFERFLREDKPKMPKQCWACKTW